MLSLAGSCGGNLGQCFNGFLNSFSDHLYDLNGVKAQIGMRIVKTQAEVEEAKLKGETVFLVKDDGVYINGSLAMLRAMFILKEKMSQKLLKMLN